MAKTTRASKTQLSFFALTLAVSALVSQAAQAASPELESALTDSLHQRVEVVKTYESNGVSGPQDGIRREKESPIAVEVGDSLPQGSSEASIRTRDERAVYREKDIASKLDRELRDIDRSMNTGREVRTLRESRRSGGGGRRGEF